ncbi:MAG: hypothetical protein M1816_004728 [Peltula sp. TS41687]|nr:MAG: hypothetical protein M1816_004728 [Peltula sp. TS41687]
MSAPGSAPLSPPGPPAPRRGGGSTPALPSAPRRTSARDALVIAAATLGSRFDKYNRRMKRKSGDRKSLSLVERNTLRFQESLLARLESIQSAYRTAHGQPPAAADSDDSDDEEDDGGDNGGDDGD